jgi:transposase/predicted nucleic acid-binding Zn finger protein
MTPREERGLVIAATQKLTQRGKVWLVPSQTGNGKKYTVLPDGETPYCSCPDFEETGGKCKHIFAVEFTISREHAKDGTITETQTMTFTQKKTYKQDWPLYNLAQTEEKRRFTVLLHDLCRGIKDPPQKPGRKRTAMSDIIFACCLKIYTCFSSRRFGTDLDEATDKGFISRKLHPGMTWAWLENPLLTPILHDLITQSSLPLRAVETSFAPDSTGFSTSRFIRWFDEKYGAVRSGREWVKAHVMCGTKTHVVTAVEIHDKDAADCPQFKPLAEKTAENFPVKEVSADKAYLSNANLELVAGLGGTAYIPFKVNSTPGEAGSLWEKMYHYYSLNKEEFGAHYHKRSNAESVFSMVKAKFRDHVRSKTDTAMKNEVLCKLLCHNICCLIMSQVELGIEPVFWQDSSAMPVPEPKEVEAVVQPKPQAEYPAAFRMACAGA